MRRAAVHALDAQVEVEREKFDSFEKEKAQEVAQLTEELERLSKLLKETEEK